VHVLVVCAVSNNAQYEHQTLRKLCSSAEVGMWTHAQMATHFVSKKGAVLTGTA
jgi:hypothetical protein